MTFLGPPRRPKMSRRRRQILLAAAGCLVVIAAVAAMALRRRSEAAYDPKATAEGITSALERQLPADRPAVSFVDVAHEAGIRVRHFAGVRSTQLPEDMGSGAAFGDYDDDGDDDLFIVNVAGPLTMDDAARSASTATSRLYRNDGGTFIDVTDLAGLGLRITGMGAAWADFDRDGRLDLAVSSYPDLFLFKQSADGTFEDVSASTGFARHKGFWTGISWADYDRDGDLDLYVCGYVRYQPQEGDREKVSLQFNAEVPVTLNPSSYKPERNLLLRNDGRGRFTDVAARSGVDNLTGRSLSAAWCDFDGDGRLDVYVANDVSDNAMFLGRANGRFQDVSHPAWVADYRGAMGLGVGDWDADGDFDIFVSHWIAQENALFNNLRIHHGAASEKLTFMDVADQVGLGQSSLEFVKWGTSFFDYDNDAKLDLLVINGSTFQDPNDRRRLIPMRHLLYWSKGDPEGFFEVSAAAGDVFRQQTVGRGAAFSDYDKDGDVDVLVVNHGGAPWLLRNDGGHRKHWLEVRVRSRNDVSGLGAIVSVAAGGREQRQQIGSQPSYLSQSSAVAHFGLGDAPLADTVRVVLPGGRVIERKSVSVDRLLVIDERGES